MKKMAKIGIMLCLMLGLSGCDSKKTEYKFNISTLDGKSIKLTKDNVLEFTNHSSQNYFEQYTVNDIKKVGYLKKGLTYTNKNLISGEEENLLLDIFVIELNNNTKATFYLKASDNIEEVLKNSNSKISELDINQNKQ